MLILCGYWLLLFSLGSNPPANHGDTGGPGHGALPGAWPRNQGMVATLYVWKWFGLGLFGALRKGGGGGDHVCVKGGPSVWLEREPSVRVER